LTKNLVAQSREENLYSLSISTIHHMCATTGIAGIKLKRQTFWTFEAVYQIRCFWKVKRKFYAWRRLFTKLRTQAYAVR